MYQLDSALAFGDMTDDDISSAEKVAREELNELLEKQLGRELNNEEKSNFFGIYAGFPEKFEKTHSTNDTTRSIEIARKS